MRRKPSFENLSEYEKLQKLRHQVLNLLDEWQKMDKSDVHQENDWLGDKFNDLCSAVLDMSETKQLRPGRSFILPPQFEAADFSPEKLRENHQKLSTRHLTRVRSFSQGKLTKESGEDSSAPEVPSYLDLVDHTLPKKFDLHLPRLPPQPNALGTNNRLLCQSATRHLSASPRSTGKLTYNVSGYSDCISERSLNLFLDAIESSGDHNELATPTIYEEETASPGASKTPSPRIPLTPPENRGREAIPLALSAAEKKRNSDKRSPRRPSNPLPVKKPDHLRKKSPTRAKGTDPGPRIRSASSGDDKIILDTTGDERKMGTKFKSEPNLEMAKFLPVGMPRAFASSDGHHLKQETQPVVRTTSLPSPKSPRSSQPKNKDPLEDSSSEPRSPYATLTKKKPQRQLTVLLETSTTGSTSPRNNQVNPAIQTPISPSDGQAEPIPDLHYPVQPSTFKASEFLLGQQDAGNIYNMRLARNKLVERAPSSTLLFDENSQPSTLIPPVLNLDHTPCSQLYLPLVKTRVLPNMISTISVLPEAQQWNSRTFIVEQHSSIFDKEYAPFEHLIWVGIAFQDRIAGDQINPYFFVTACRRDASIFFLETTNHGHHEWQRTITTETKKGKTIFRFLNSKNKLCAKTIEEELVSHYQFAHFHLLPPKATMSLLRLDRLIVDSKHSIEIGVLYRKKGQFTRDDISSNRDLPYGKFLTFLRALGCPTSGDPHNRTSVFNRNISVKWLLAVDFNNDDFRRYIGNCMNIIIFNDSDEPFDPFKLFLGKITNMLCVVQPNPKPIQARGPTMFRLGFFLQYERGFSNEAEITHIIAENEKLIRSVQFGPEVPHNYIFDNLSIGKFVLTKFYNGMMASLRTYPTAKAFFTQPILIHINQIVKNLLPDWHTKVSKTLKKMDNS